MSLEAFDITWCVILWLHGAFVGSSIAVGAAAYVRNSRAHRELERATYEAHLSALSAHERVERLERVNKLSVRVHGI
jgi:hypothetical protein